MLLIITAIKYTLYTIVIILYIDIYRYNLFSIIEPNRELNKKKLLKNRKKKDSLIFRYEYFKII